MSHLLWLVRFFLQVLRDEPHDLRQTNLVDSKHRLHLVVGMDHPSVVRVLQFVLLHVGPTATTKKDELATERIDMATEDDCTKAIETIQQQRTTL